MIVATANPLQLLGLLEALPQDCHAYPFGTPRDKCPIARSALGERASFSSARPPTDFATRPA